MQTCNLKAIETKVKGRAEKPLKCQAKKVELGPFDVIQHLKKKAFLVTFAEMGNTREAAKSVGIDRSTVYVWRRLDEEFQAAFQIAEELAGDALEDEARKRAFAGSDLLLIFLLKGLKPERYRENRASLQYHQEPPASVVTLDELLAPYRGIE